MTESSRVEGQRKNRRGVIAVAALLLSTACAAAVIGVPRATLQVLPSALSRFFLVGRLVPPSPFDAQDAEEKQTDEGQLCAGFLGQCGGGEGYDGPTCCEEGSVCVAKPMTFLPSYRMCIGARREGREQQTPEKKEKKQMQKEVSSPGAAKQKDRDAQGRPAAPPQDPQQKEEEKKEDEHTSECAKLWGQCGGDGHSGPVCCEEGSTCTDNPLKDYASYRQCRNDGEEQATVEGASETCARMWEQCGGEGYHGARCCEEGSQCRRKPLPEYPSYEQCQEPACEDPAPGSKCHERVMWDIQVGVWKQPEWYRGLTAESDFKEFQEYEHRWNYEVSQCKPPCADGTCFVVYRYEGCDTMSEWTCEVDDGSLAFACCCKYQHEEKAEAAPDDIGEDLSHAMQVSKESSPTLFCVALCFPIGYELGLLRAQYSKGRHGVFSCNHWAVHSNKTLRLTPKGEKPVLYTGVINGSLDAKVGGKYHTALNTGIFIRFWNKVIEDPAASKCDWVVKLDPDTLFLANRFRALVSARSGPLSKPEPEHGFWLNNCHLGLHGPIEVLSRRALDTYRRKWRQCAFGHAASHRQEDVYIRECFRELGVQKVDAYNLLFEAELACQERPAAWNPLGPPCFAPQVAFHPFKTIEGYMHCYSEVQRHPWALPTGPVSEPPSHKNQWHA